MKQKIFHIAEQYNRSFQQISIYIAAVLTFTRVSMLGNKSLYSSGGTFTRVSRQANKSLYSGDGTFTRVSRLGNKSLYSGGGGVLTCLQAGK